MTPRMAGLNKGFTHRRFSRILGITQAPSVLGLCQKSRNIAGHGQPHYRQPRYRQPRYVRPYHIPSRSGYSLIDVIISIVILATTVLAVFDLVMIGIRRDNEAIHYSVARSIVQQQMEYIRTLPYYATGISSATITASLGSSVSLPLSGSCPASDVAANSPSAALPNGTGTVTFTQENGNGQPGLCLVTFDIEWDEPGQGHDVFAMDTYVTDKGLNSI